VTLGELLASIGQRLAAAGIPYMVTGSVASSFHGEPRATRDLDLVIDPSPAALDRFVGELPAEKFYVDRLAATTALADRSQFNVIDQVSGWKVDLMIRQDRPFSIQAFKRRLPAELLGTPTFLATAEDVVIAKLEWSKAGGSERQLRDVIGILAITNKLDDRYVERWVERLQLGDVWAKVRRALEERG
jgi:hypothetical protein